MILACHNLNKAFGEHTIVCDGSFHIEDREKACLLYTSPSPRDCS